MAETIAWRSRLISRLRFRKAASKVTTGSVGKVHAFKRDENGTVAIVFALTSFLVVSMVGGAVDFGRAYALKAKIQAAVDASSLAAASAYANDPNHDINAAIAHAQQFYNASMNDVTGATMSASLAPETQTVTMSGTASLKTPFLSLVGINNITLEAIAEATTSESLTGGGSSNEVEITLMLDITGSMDESAGGGQTKIQALKSAAKTFIDVLIPNTGTPKVKIALAPFAQRINLGDTYITIATGQPLSKQITDGDVCGWTFSNGNWNARTCTAYLSRCTTEREGNDAFTDATPGTNRYFPATWLPTLSNAQNCGTSNSDGPRSSILPMTTNKVTLKAQIDALNTWGGTAGQLGTAWAWYMLSPTWSTIFTGEGAPKAYKTDKLKKIAVLMTDGEYNTWYSSSQGNSISQAKKLCTNMKATGKEIEVYTVGFKLDTADAIATLNNCATNSSHAFLAENAAQLEAVFKDIAFRSVPLHLAR